MAFFDAIIDPVMDWWESDNVIGDIVGAAGDTFFGGGDGGSGQGTSSQFPPLKEKVGGFIATDRVGFNPGRTSDSGVTQQDEYFAMRDSWRARLVRAQDFADTSDEVIRAPVGTSARRN